MTALRSAKTVDRAVNADTHEGSQQLPALNYSTDLACMRVRVWTEGHLFFPNDGRSGQHKGPVAIEGPRTVFRSYCGGRNLFSPLSPCQRAKNIFFELSLRVSVYAAMPWRCKLTVKGMRHNLAHVRDCR